ncbi:MAG TPA: hypothetical protein ENK06_14875 [Gammaproteobacteria bacterium]|nr:hypothetical protein [Gammaproteobacteria bacterium]
MKATEKHRAIFGEIRSLAEEIPWTTGVSNMLEWLTWSTNDVLGITKTRYWKLIVKLSHDPSIRNGSIEEKEAFVKARLDALIKESERSGRYDKPSSSVASPREALRRAKYFSEDYLNKEFDIFWGLVSDAYLDQYYGQFISVQPGGSWYCHGNSGLFSCSTEISVMQMDNLSYNPDRNLLVANELKLGGQKNKDQILKYALMYHLLVERGFIDKGTRFVLFFIGDKPETPDWEALIQDELEYCRASTKSTLKEAMKPECVEIASGADYVSTSWSDLYDFNELYAVGLSAETQQVELKLIRGFNEALGAKAFFRANLDARSGSAQ